jgi:prevent-host-death family protein
MTEIGLFDAKTHLSALVDRAEKGEEFLITRHGHGVARLVPVREIQAIPRVEALDTLIRFGQGRKLIPAGGEHGLHRS